MVQWRAPMNDVINIRISESLEFCNHWQMTACVEGSSFLLTVDTLIPTDSGHAHSYWQWTREKVACLEEMD